MKRLIALRQQHPRVRPRHDRVPAAREPQGARLRPPRRRTKRSSSSPTSRASVQPVEVDLSAFTGLTPVEMLGLTEFPRIGGRAVFPHAGPVRLVLVHAGDPADAGVADAAGSRPAAAPAIVENCRRCWWASTGTTCSTRGRGSVARAPGAGAFLERQRWFASKARGIRDARSSTGYAARRSSPAFVTVVSVKFTEGPADTYVVPLSMVRGSTPLAHCPSSLARCWRGSPAPAKARSSTACSTTMCAGGWLNERSRVAAAVDERSRARHPHSGRRDAAGTEMGARIDRPEQLHRVPLRALRVEALSLYGNRVPTRSSRLARRSPALASTGSRRWR